MMTIYNVDLDTSAVSDNLHRIGNQIFKLLPMKEEEQDCDKPIETLVIELVGMGNLFSDQKKLISLASKLEGLKDISDVYFFLYRRTIFECCNLVNQLREQCQ